MTAHVSQAWRVKERGREEDTELASEAAGERALTHWSVRFNVN